MSLKMLPVHSSLIQTSLSIQYQVVSYGYFRTGHLPFHQGHPGCPLSKQIGTKMATVGAAGRGSAALDLAAQAPVPTPSPAGPPLAAPLPKGREGHGGTHAVFPASLPGCPECTSGAFVDL